MNGMGLVDWLKVAADVALIIFCVGLIYKAVWKGC